MLLPTVAYAALACPEGISCNANLDPNQLILAVINWMLSITLALSVLFIVIGGFMYMTSAGNEERVEKGKETVTNALVGLVIVILAYTIAKLVEQFFLRT